MTHRLVFRCIEMALVAIAISVSTFGQERGDGNGDGIPDSEQGHVTSFPNKVDQRRVTLASHFGRFVEVRSIHPESQFPNIPDVPAAVHLPIGVLSFEVHDVGAPPNHVVNVDLLLPGVSITGYWVYGREPDDPTYHWYELRFDNATGTGAEILAEKVAMTLVDGGVGDEDMVVNGVIVHCGGPVASGGRVKPRLNPYFGVARACSSW